MAGDGGGYLMARRMPTSDAIREFWAPRLWGAKGYDSMNEFLEADYCFACGWLEWKTERAHILARSKGGSDDVENLHLLCPTCHQDSEALSGSEYDKWLMSRHSLDMVFSTAIRCGRLQPMVLRETVVVI